MQTSDVITKDALQSLFEERLLTLDLEAAKQDVRPFVRDASALESWSVDFFRYWIKKLQFTNV